MVTDNVIYFKNLHTCLSLQILVGSDWSRYQQEKAKQPTRTCTMKR